jgi:aspartate/methionine/tyrosine aminotransferase
LKFQGNSKVFTSIEAALQERRQVEHECQQADEQQARADRLAKQIEQATTQALSTDEIRSFVQKTEAMSRTWIRSRRPLNRLALAEKDFGSDGEGHLQVCFATSRENIDFALERIESWLRFDGLVG